MCFCFYSQTTSRIFKWCIGLVSHKDFHGNWQRNPVFTAHLRLPLTTRKNLFHDWLMRIHACILLSLLFSGFQLIPSSESRPRNFIVIVHSEVAYQPRHTNQLLLLDSPTRSLGADLHEHQLIFLSWQNICFTKCWENNKYMQLSRASSAKQTWELLLSPGFIYSRSASWPLPQSHQQVCCFVFWLLFFSSQEMNHKENHHLSFG